MTDTAVTELMAPGANSAAGERAGFDSVIALYRSKVFRFAFASLRDRDLAETVTQDCLLKAHRASSAFRHDCSVETWLMHIAVNLVRDYGRNRRFQFWRRAAKRAESIDVSSAWLPGKERSPEHQAIMRQQVAAVWDAAGRLPEGQRTAFLLRFVEDMDILEIAAAMGVKEGTVKAHLSRALQAVRERLGVRQ